jgi:predicted DNA repair protein MutK
VVPIGITLAVYGIIALIINIDNLRIYLDSHGKKWSSMLGQVLLWFAPQLMKALSLLGTIAMFLVSGSIWFHAIGVLHDVDHSLLDIIHHNISAGWLQSLTSLLASIFWQGIIGLIVTYVLLIFSLIEPLVHKYKSKQISS